MKKNFPVSKTHTLTEVERQNVAKSVREKQVKEMTELVENTTITEAPKLKIKIRPLGVKILVQENNAEKQTKSGILLPASMASMKKEIFGTAISVGRNVEEVIEGDTVIYLRDTGIETEIDGNKYHFVREDEILGVVENI